MLANGSPAWTSTKASGRRLITSEPAWDEDSIRIPRLFAFFFFPTPRKSTTRTTTPELKAPKKTPVMKPFSRSLAIAALSTPPSQAQAPVKLGKPARRSSNRRIIRSTAARRSGLPLAAGWKWKCSMPRRPRCSMMLTFKYTILNRENTPGWGSDLREYPGGPRSFRGDVCHAPRIAAADRRKTLDEREHRKRLDYGDEARPGPGSIKHAPGTAPECAACPGARPEQKTRRHSPRFYYDRYRSESKPGQALSKAEYSWLHLHVS